jgi:hypothetical protein
MRIIDSARKHGISDEAMLHAVRFAVRAVRQDDRGDGDLTLLIGADVAGRLLEVVVADLERDDPRIVHANVLRASFHVFL